MATALKGDVDAILLTGGIAHSKRVTDFIADHVDYIAPIYVYPGENELRALAENALAVLRGERTPKEYESTASEDPSQINDEERPSKLRDWLLLAVSPPTGAKPMTAIRHYLRKWGPVLIALYGFYRYSHKHQKRSIHAIEIGSEAEEIYVPGDRTRFDKEDYNDED